MDQRYVVLAGIGSAVVIAAVLGAVTETPALLGATPAGAAVYLVVGVGAPQVVLGRRTGDSGRLGVGVLAIAAGAILLLAGTVLASVGPWLQTALVVVVGGSVAGAAVREFRRGYGVARTGE